MINIEYNKERDSYVVFVDGEWYYESETYNTALAVFESFF